MNNTEYSLAKLWPNFTQLLNGEIGITTPGGVSAIIVLVLFLIFTIFTVWSVVNYLSANKQLKFYSDLLKGLTVEQLAEKRRGILKEAEKSTTYFDLWREFDESLVYIPARDRLCNTIDAEHFFNSHTIARKLTENRLLAAIPSFLTAIGVIGTFAGLQMGLAELDVSSDNFDTLKQGIAGLIGGASIAFMTSVWGVITSVLFNFFEKCLERNIRSQINNLQNRVDYLYPRITAEQSLNNIEDFSKQSLEKLAELDEKIGHKMQEAMQQASDSIREGMESSLNSILGPAIAQLVDNAHNGSEKALESLLERFLDGVGKAGESQRKMMDSAAGNIGEATSGMIAGLSGFTSQLDGQIDAMVSKNADVMSGFEAVIKDQLSAQRDLDNTRQTQADNYFTQLQGSQTKLTTGLDDLLITQKMQNESMVTEFSQLTSSFNELAQAHHESSKSMQIASADIKASSNQLGLLSTNLKDTTDKLASQLINMVQEITKSSELNAQNINLVDQLSQQLQNLQMNMQDISTTLNSAAEKAESGLTAVDQHFNQLMNSLEAHVTDLNKQVASLLEDFAERVKDQTVDRMRTWNEETSAYLNTMTDAVRAINGVVDEIDNKLSPNSQTGNS